MKKKKLHIGLAAVTGLMALTACSADDAGNSILQENSDDISLVSSMGGMTRSVTELQTNAVSTDVTVGAFGVAGTTVVTNGTNNQYNVTSTGELEAVANDMKWPSDPTAKVDIFAYAPYQSSWAANSANSFSVSTDQSTDAGYLASDLLYASSTNLSKTSSAVVLNFSHKLARINVTLTKGESCTFDLSKSTVSIGGTKIGTTLNPSTGALGAASGDVKDVKIGNEVNITASGVTAYGVVVPQEMAVGTQFVKIVADGKLLSANLSSAVTLEAGKAYNFNAEISSSTEEVTLTLGSVTLTDWGTGSDLQTGEIEEMEYEYSPTSFVALTGGQNATYADGTYTWTASTNNLMTILEFPLSDDNTLANFKTLEITVSELSEGASWRVGFAGDNISYTNFTGSPSSANGKLTIDLTALTNVDLSKVTKIQLGGASNASTEESKSLKISPSDVVLKGYVATTEEEEETSTLTATFQTPGSNASYNATSYSYSWTGSTSNLMTVFEFSNGELANYATLEFTFSDLVDGPVRMGYYVGSTFTEFGNGYYSAGAKTVDLATLGIDLSTVTKIAFGGKSNAGSCTIKASDVKLIPSN